MDLLNGRLRVRLPAGARNEARGHSIMAAPQSVQQETRLVLDAGRERLVVMSYELFATAGDDLAAAVRKYLAEDGATEKIEPLTLAGLRAIVAVPTTHDLKREAIPVLDVFVASPDSTVQALAFFVNPAGGTDIQGVTELARRSAATLAAGPAKLPSTTGSRVLSDGLHITVPAGYVATRQDGPDFTVHHLRKLGPLGEPTTRVGIYLGGHPAYQHKQVDDTPVALKKTAGKLLGQAMEWHTWTRGKPPTQVTTMEAIVPHGSGLLVHVFMSAPSEAALAEPKAIAETLAPMKAP
jgi:hypothetical protein